MAMNCPKKKEIMNRKKNERTDETKTQTEQTYATIVEKTIKKVTDHKVTESRQINEDSTMKTLLMIMDAHIANVLTPGTYNSHLNKTLKMNNLPAINFPEPTNSDRLLNKDKMHDLIYKTLEDNQAKKTLRTATKETPGPSYQTKRPEPLKRTTAELSDDSNSDSDGSSDSNHMDIHDVPETPATEILTRHIDIESITPREATDYGLEIIATERPNTQKHDLQPHDLTNEYENNTIKYKLDYDSKYQTQNVEHLLSNCRLFIRKHNITYLDETEYKKIRNGRHKTPTKKASKKTKQHDKPRPT
jgi:hypothetical protein